MEPDTGAVRYDEDLIAALPGHRRECGAQPGGQAARAFGWPREWAAQLERARAQFPGITY